MVAFIGCLSLVPVSQSIGDTTAPLLTGARLRQELQRTINVTRPDVRLREIVERLSELHHIAILLDRRIDPDQHIDVQLSQVTLMDGFKQLASQVDADTAVVSGTIVIGPTDSLDRTRTDIVIQHQMLKDSSNEQGQRRLIALLAGKTFLWSDLETPQSLVQSIAAQYEVEVSGLDQIPHDLWAAGEMADVSAAEALTLVVGQYDLTCLWNEDATAVQLAPASKRLTIERSLPFNPARFAPLLPLLNEEVPLAQVRLVDDSLQVVASISEHERIVGLIKGKPDNSPAPLPGQQPLKSRTFTLTTQRATTIAVLRTLESQGTNVEYDSDALQAAGIDLSQKVTLSLNKATADELFQALCEPLGLDYEIDGATVRLTPKP